MKGKNLNAPTNETSQSGCSPAAMWFGHRKGGYQKLFLRDGCKANPENKVREDGNHILDAWKKERCGPVIWRSEKREREVVGISFLLVK